MTRMNSGGGHKQKKDKNMAVANGRPAADIPAYFSTGTLAELQQQLDHSFAISYDGPLPNGLVPIAPLAFPFDGKKGYLPIAQPYKGPLPSEFTPSTSGSSFPVAALVSACADGTEKVRAASPNAVATSEIEEVITSPSPSGQFLGRTPSSEGLVTDSSVLQYSEEFSAHDSEQLPERLDSGRYTLDPSPSGKRENLHRKSGQCYHCLKGHWFTDRETCLVCGRKYCANCVLLIMGSMPEGRKCESCVGHPILESQRSSLGKSSRLLKKLLSTLEIELCMKSERECLANQLHPEQVSVNGRPLSAEEMAELLAYVRLKPGRYWYDKASGLWGKEGEKPDSVIAANLKVGGSLPPTASRGNTQVFLNGREITKSELKMLKTIGVQCTPSTYLVLFPDGRYGDEGQKEPKGNLWNKPTMKLLHLFFSFPTPRSSNPEFPATSRKVSPAVEVRDASKILLLGHEGSGRTTIFKQAKILHDAEFWPHEVDKYKNMILQKCYNFLRILLEARENFEDEFASTQLKDDSRKNIYSLSDGVKESVENFLVDMTNGQLERTTQLDLSKIWNDLAVREAYIRKDELHMLPEVSGDLLSRVLQAADYVPLQSDILLAEGLEQGTGLAEVEFSLEDKDSLADSSGSDSSRRRYQLISIGGLATNEFRKWLGMFEDVKLLVYCVAISDYDQLYTDSAGVQHNKLVFSRDLFVKIVNYPCFHDTPLVLLLNKYDKFEEKVSKGVPLTRCEWFSDYSPVGSSHSSHVQQAYMYVVHKFKRLLGSRRVYTLQLNAQEQRSVSVALEYVQQILKCEEEKKAGWMSHEESIYGDSSFTVQVVNNKRLGFS